MSEFIQKQIAIQEFLANHGCDALILQKVSSFAWATCGAASYINTATADGTGSLLITPQGRYLITTNIEAPRFADEERLVEQGWELRPYPWHETSGTISELSRGFRLAADGFFPGAQDLSGPLSRLRSVLLPEEQERFRKLGNLCAEAMNEAILQVRPGMTENEIAALLANAAQKRGVQAIVNLIATDERIYAYRHPLPTGKKMDRYAMLVLCGRRWGLVCSITRLVHFGTLPDDLKRKQAAVAQVDAAFLTATRPGKSLAGIFAQAMATYAETGFGDEWRLHHQGGPAGYEPREYVGTPTSTDFVSAGQAYAWNPSITGVKSEDTILIGETQNDVLTEIAGWPGITVSVSGSQVSRPAILEIK
jgi:Xaa-Pro aminopeptidase